MDLLFLKKLMNGDEMLVTRFVGIFQTQAPGQVAALRQFLVQQQWEELSNGAHSLKTQFNYLGLNGFSEQMAQIEASVDDEKYAGLDELITRFQNEFNAFWKNEFPSG